MLLIVRVIHTYDNAIEHRENWHTFYSCFDYNYFLL